MTGHAGVAGLAGRARRGGLAVVAAAFLVVAPLGIPASAASQADGTLAVRRVDASSAPTVRVDVWAGNQAVPADGFGLREEGKSVRVAAVPLSSALATGTVLLVDTSTAVDDVRMAGARAGLVTLVTAKRPNDAFAIIAYGGSPRVVQDFTRDADVLLNAITRLRVSGGPALHAGVVAAADLLDAEPQALAQLVIVGTGANVGPVPDPRATTAALLSSKALTIGVGLTGAGSVPAEIESLAAIGGGMTFAAADAAGRAIAFGAAARALSNQYELTYTSGLGSRAGSIAVTNGARRGAAQVVPGALAVGDAVNPPASRRPSVPGFLGGSVGLLLIGLLVLGAAALGVYSLLSLIAGDGVGLGAALRPYQRSPVGGATEPDVRGAADVGRDPTQPELAQTALVRRAVRTTARIAERQGILQPIEARLEQAHLSVRAAEALFFYLAAAVILVLLAFLTEGPVPAVLVTVLLAVAAPTLLNRLASARRRKFSAQLPDALGLIASSLRAGTSFFQALDAASQEVSEPMGAELRRVVAEARLGRSLHESLGECAQRMGSPDFSWAVMAVSIQREIGGNLAELLQAVGTTMVERERLRRDVSSLTAEGRMSAIVLGCLPPGLGVFFAIARPAYIRPLYTHPGGQLALALATVGMAAGVVWMRKIVDVEL